MVVHGFYHLMGLDHMNEDEKKEMREKKKKHTKQIKYNKLNKKGQAMKPKHKENNNTEEKKN